MNFVFNEEFMEKYREAREANRKKPELRHGILMCVLFAISLSVTTLSGSLMSFVFFITAVASGAMVFCLFPFYVWPLPVAAAALVTAFLADTPILAVGILLPVVVALVFGLFSRNDKALSPSIGTATAVIVLSVAALGVLLVYHYQGSLTVDSIIAFAKRCHGFLTRNLEKMFVYKDGETQLSVLTYEQISAFVRTIIAVLPGYVVCFSFIISYICSWLYRRFLSAFGYAVNIIPFFFHFDMSLVSASVFLIMSILSFFLAFFSKAEIAYFASENMRIMLLPAFTMLGFRWVKQGFAKLRRKGARFGCLFVLLIPVVMSGSVIALLSPLLTFLSVAGAILVVKNKAPRIDFSGKKN